jgi:hypothetical protein
VLLIVEAGPVGKGQPPLLRCLHAVQRCILLVAETGAAVLGVCIGVSLLLRYFATWRQWPAARRRGVPLRSGLYRACVGSI